MREHVLGELAGDAVARGGTARVHHPPAAVAALQPNIRSKRHTQRREFAHALTPIMRQHVHRAWMTQTGSGN